MLYQFKSKVTGDLIMLEPNGRRILEIMGKAPDVKGIIQPFQMPAAIAALEAAIHKENTLASSKNNESTTDLDDDALVDQMVCDQTVSLRQRAQPMLEMLRRCYQSQADIVWGV